MVSPSSPAASFVVRHRVHLGVLGALFLVGAFLVWRFVQRWDLFLESKVRPWAEAEVLRVSDSAYSLKMGTLAFNAFPGRIAIDSLRITTDSERNRRRPRPLADVTALVVDCELRGINTWQLIKRGGLSANQFSCKKIDIAADLPALADAKPHPAPAAPRHAFLTPEESIQLPPLIPVVEIDRLELPLISLALNRHGSSADERIQVTRLFADVRGTRIVSGEPAGHRTLFSDHVEVGGQGISFHTGSGANETAVMLGGLKVNLTLDESSFEGTGVFLLGAVLEQFFAKYVSLNSFTETVVRTLERGVEHHATEEAHVGADAHRRSLQHLLRLRDAFLDLGRVPGHVARRRAQRAHQEHALAALGGLPQPRCRQRSGDDDRVELDRGCEVGARALRGGLHGDRGGE